ncbi:HU family DNA-binding protein [Fusobacterium sp. PH5-44]|uniref:HU family DNA-binding protein n=1 Tax=unclassified Fusobacterium TaxID=2648384 RepID=UPI003D25233A
MTKKEFVELYYAKGEFTTKAEAERKTMAFIETVKDALGAGEEVSFLGFGKFKVVDRAARTARNPQTGAEMKIPAKKAVKFTAGKDLGVLVNSKKK